MFSSAVPYKNQHYDELKKNCIKDKVLFEDPEFPATNSSIYFRKPPPGRVQWKRPGVRMGRMGRWSSLEDAIIKETNSETLSFTNSYRKSPLVSLTCLLRASVPTT